MVVTKNNSAAPDYLDRWLDGVEALARRKATAPDGTFSHSRFEGLFLGICLLRAVQAAAFLYLGVKLVKWIWYL